MTFVKFVLLLSLCSLPRKGLALLLNDKSQTGSNPPHPFSHLRERCRSESSIVFSFSVYKMGNGHLIAAVIHYRSLLFVYDVCAFEQVESGCYECWQSSPTTLCHAQSDIVTCVLLSAFGLLALCNVACISSFHIITSYNVVHYSLHVFYFVH